MAKSKGTPRLQTPEHTCGKMFNPVCHFIELSVTVHCDWGMFVFLVAF